MMAAGGACLTLGLGGGALHHDRSLPWMDLLVSSTLRYGMIFLPSGIGAFILSSSHPRTPRGTLERGDAEEDRSWLVLFVGTLLALSCLTWVLAKPLPALWRETLVLLKAWGIPLRLNAYADEFGGLMVGPIVFFLQAPILVSATAMVLIGAPAVLLAPIFLKSGRLPRAYLALILIQASLLVGSMNAIGLMDRVTPRVRKELAEERSQSAAMATAWLDRHDALMQPAAHHLSWLFLGYAVWVPFLFFSPRARRTFVDSEGAFGTADLGARVSQGRYGRSETTAVLGDEPLIDRGHPRAIDPRSYKGMPELRFSSYVIRPRSVIAAGLPWLARVQEIAAGTRPVLYSDPGFLNLARPLRVLRMEDGKDVFLVRPTRSFLPRQYEVIDTTTHEKLGAFRKKDFKGSFWSVMNGLGREVGWVKRVDAGLGFRKYELCLDGTPVCRLSWTQSAFRPEVEVDFSPDLHQQLDRRFAICIGLTLERHAWFWLRSGQA